MDSVDSRVGNRAESIVESRIGSRLVSSLKSRIVSMVGVGVG